MLPLGIGPARDLVSGEFELAREATTGTGPTWSPDPHCEFLGVADFATGNAERFAATPTPNDIVTGYPFTMTCWVRPRSTFGQHNLMFVAEESGAAVYYGLQVDMAGGLFRVIASNTTQIDGTGGTTAVNTWFHVAGVFASATDRKLYVDGVEVGSSTTSVTFGTSIDNVTLAVIKTISGIFNPLDGFMAEGRMYGRELTAFEVKHQYEPATRWGLYIEERPIQYFFASETGFPTSLLKERPPPIFKR